MGGFQTQQRNARYKNLICLVTQSCLTPLKVNTISNIHCMSYGKNKNNKKGPLHVLSPPSSGVQFSFQLHLPFWAS